MIKFVLVFVQTLCLGPPVLLGGDDGCLVALLTVSHADVASKWINESLSRRGACPAGYCCFGMNSTRS